MSRYKGLGVSEGAEFMPKVWNLDFKPLGEDNHFVETWKNRALADCAEFRLSSSIERSEIIFFAKDPELVDFLTQEQGQLYLYGAYNQIDVVQMRAKGSVARLESHSEAGSIKQRLQARIVSRVGSFVSKLSEEEASERYAILNEGHMFCFRPVEYAYSSFERG